MTCAKLPPPIAFYIGPSTNRPTTPPIPCHLPLYPSPADSCHGPLWTQTIAKIYADTGLSICKPPDAQPTASPGILALRPELAPVTDHHYRHALNLLEDLHDRQQWIPPDHFPADLRTHLQPLPQEPTHQFFGFLNYSLKIHYVKNHHFRISFLHSFYSSVNHTIYNHPWQFFPLKLVISRLRDSASH